MQAAVRCLPSLSDPNQPQTLLTSDSLKALFTIAVMPVNAPSFVTRRQLEAFQWRFSQIEPDGVQVRGLTRTIRDCPSLL